MTEEAICVLWVKGGSGPEEPGMIDYASDWKWPLKKRPVIAHIKARSKHFSLTISPVNTRLKMRVLETHVVGVVRLLHSGQASSSLRILNEHFRIHLCDIGN